MFFTYPDGWPGAGLVLLRIAGGAFLAIQGLAYALDSSGHPHLGGMFGLLGFASGVLLLIGYKTRVAALVGVIACGASLLSSVYLSRSEILAPRLPSLLVVVIAVAVLCLGPGAFSLDALRFGRREVMIPKDPPDPQR